jgi:site-specific DNA recombinase
MKKASKPAPAADPARKQAVIYARVSSKEQEKEGFSIPAQLKLLKEYAAANGFAVVQEYVDVETAKQTGRTAFGEMVVGGCGDARIDGVKPLSSLDDPSF